MTLLKNGPGRNTTLRGLFSICGRYIFNGDTAVSLNFMILLTMYALISCMITHPFMIMISYAAVLPLSLMTANKIAAHMYASVTVFIISVMLQSRLLGAKSIIGQAMWTAASIFRYEMNEYDSYVRHFATAVIGTAMTALMLLFVVFVLKFAAIDLIAGNLFVINEKAAEGFRLNRPALTLTALMFASSISILSNTAASIILRLLRKRRCVDNENNDDKKAMTFGDEEDGI